MFSWKRKRKIDPSLPAPEDDYDRAILDDITRVGWSVLQINAEDGEHEPDFAFSAGLFHTHKHPEIIIVGLPHEVSGEIINTIGAYVLLGNKIETDVVTEDFIGVGSVFKTVDPRHYEAYVGYARWLYGGSNFPLLQCVWPLKSGHYPWDPGYPPEGASRQPYLG